MKNRNQKFNNVDHASNNKRTNAKNAKFKGKRWSKNKSSRSNQDEVTAEKTANDPSWYGSNAIAQASSNVFFSQRFGTPVKDLLPERWDAELNVTLSQVDCAIPGIQVLNLVPSFGWGGGYDSPINIASQAMYSFVRHANSGSRNYDAPDLMTYVIGMSEVYSFITYLMRVYGFANTYYPENTYMAKALLTSMGVDFDSIIGNMAQFNYAINVLINKATAFAVPGGMSFFQRKAFLYQNVFIESDNIKDQLYLFNPAGFYMYTVDDTRPEAYLKYEAMEQHGRTMNDLIAYGNRMIQQLLDSEDIGICSGDIIKAYGSELIKLSEMPGNYKLTPVVGDENIMYQIRNATIASYYQTSDLHQDDSKLYLDYDPVVEMSGTSIWNNRELYLMTGDRLITSNRHDPDSGTVMESTRLMVNFANWDLTDSSVIADAVCGTEVCVYVSTYTYVRNRNTGALTLQEVTYTNNVIQPATGTTAQYDKITNISAFRFHPTFYIFSGTDQSAFQFKGWLQEVETYTTIDDRELMNIHEAALLNMIAVPSIAKL